LKSRLGQTGISKESSAYRVIYAIDERAGIVKVLHIQHGARRPFSR
jgi:hypothetical protein